MRKPRLPKHMIFHHDLHLLIFRPRGVLTEKRIDKDIAILEVAEDQMAKPFDRFSDFSKTKRFELDSDYVFRISLHRRLKYVNHSPVKSAFYVTNNEAAQIVRMHALITNNSPLQVEIFDKIENAADWLGVSVGNLQIGS